jgi:hypothetical protein
VVESAVVREYVLEVGSGPRRSKFRIGGVGSRVHRGEQGTEGFRV